MPSYSSDSIIQDTQTAITELLRTVKLYWFYAESHPAAKEIVNKLSIQLAGLVAEGPLTLNLTKDEIFLGSVPLDKKNKNNTEFCRQLNKRRIYSITILPGISESETSTLVRLLAMDPKQIRRQGGMRKLLLDKKVTHIDISEYLYDIRPTAGSEGVQVEESESSHFMDISEENVKRFQSFLKGEIESLPPEEEDVFLEFMQNPARFAELMNLNIPLTIQSTETTQIIQPLQQSIHRIHRWVIQRSSQEKSMLMRKIATSLLHNRSNLGVDTLMNRETMTPEQMQSIKEVVEHLSDEELLDLVLKGTAPNESPEEMKPLLSQLPIEDKRVINLTKKYINLLERKQKGELDQLELNKLHERFQEYNNNLIFADAVQVALELFQTERQSTVSQDILDLLLKSFPELIKEGYLDVCQDLLITVNHSLSDKDVFSQEIQVMVEKFLSQLASDENVNKVILKLGKATTQEEENLIDVLSLMGQPVVNRVMNTFCSSTQFTLRRPLSRVLLKLGDRAISEIISHIHSSPEDMAKELISILGQIQTPAALDNLRKILPQLHPSLRQHAIMVLADYSPNDTRDWFIDELRLESDPMVRTACLEGLAKIGDEESIHIIRDYAFRMILKNDSERPLQQRAIQLLGKLNVIDAVPDLIRVFKSARWIPSKKRDQLRIIIAQTLWKMDDNRARQTVKDGCRDFRRSVRRMCESLVTVSSQISESESKNG